MSVARLRARNRKRAAAARAALRTYCTDTQDDEGRAGLVDLIADCGHLAQSLGLDFPDVVRRALAHWDAEQLHPDGLEAVVPSRRTEVSS